MKRRALLPAVVAACGVLWLVAVAAAEPPVSSSFTDMTDPTTRVTTSFTDSNGDTVTKTTIDGHFTSVTNGMTGPFHTTIFRIAHSNGVADTTGVDFCLSCTDPAGNTGTIGNHLIGVTGGATHTDLGNGSAGLVNDRGTYTISSAGGVVTDSGVLATSPCIAGTHVGPLVIAVGDSECLAPGGRQVGPVIVQSGGHFYSNGASITGGLSAASPAAVSICGTHITGGLWISGATAPVLVREPATGDCNGNQLEGPVVISGDTEGTDVSGNTITGPVTLMNNVGGFIFGDVAQNTITGSVVNSGNV